jgi:hypothetical protein
VSDLSQMKPVHVFPYLLKIFLILSPHMRQYLSSYVFLSLLPSRTLYEFLFSAIRADLLPLSFPLALFHKWYLVKIKNQETFITHFSPTCCYSITDTFFITIILYNLTHSAYILSRVTFVSNLMESYFVVSNRG